MPRDPPTKARAFRDPDGRFVQAPWYPDPAAWRRAAVSDHIGPNGIGERELLHVLLNASWDAADIEATLRELGVVKKRVFGQPFGFLVLPDGRPERWPHGGFRFRAPRGGGTPIDGLGNLRPGTACVAGIPARGAENLAQFTIGLFRGRAEVSSGRGTRHRSALRAARTPARDCAPRCASIRLADWRNNTGKSRSDKGNGRHAQTRVRVYGPNSDLRYFGSPLPREARVVR
jgi:hypothetical protein